jgi:alginate O-acetyltransferase complex protein AlgI
VLFPTIRFALFFAVVLPVSWLLMPRPVRWKVFMVLASYTFYAAWDWRFVGLLVASTIGNQVAAQVIGRSRDVRLRRIAVGLAVAANLGALAWFKYAGFFVDVAWGVGRLLSIDGPAPFVEVVLPVGISFFTFQAISYVIDVHRGTAHPAPLLDVAVYLAFFPQLVAGPIVRASELLPQLRSPRDPRRVAAGLAFWLIAAGLVKKVVVASYLADEIVDPFFALPFQHAGLGALIGIYAYAIQIYADFSGYTDIAIGVALLLGFRFPPNFDAPYAATSLQDFWRRWHMTLSRWLRDYLYVGLGGNRGGRLLTYRNLMLTMLLGGLWHGAAWTFVIWGGIHGGGLVLSRWWGERRAARAEAGLPVPPPLSPWIRRIITFHLVCVAWVFFRADSVSGAFEVLGRVTDLGPGQAVNPMVVTVIALMLASQLVPRRSVEVAQVAFSRMAPLAQGVVLALVLTAIDVLGPEGVAPFIYFQF